MTHVRLNGLSIFVWLKKNNRTQIWLARTMRVHRMAVNHWVNDVDRPNDQHRRKLAKLSKGELPVDGWLTDAEREELRKLQP